MLQQIKLTHIFVAYKYKIIKMKKTLIILAHPNMESSVANKAIINEVINFENVEVRDIAKLYPDFKIDIKSEQNALLGAEKIIFQYPIYWYNMPSILKQWFDVVLTYGFAFGENNYNLEGKEMLVSVTTGGPKDGYDAEILGGKILFPLEGTASFCKMKYLSPVVIHGMMSMPGTDTKPLVEIAKKHAQKIIEIIKK